MTWWPFPVPGPFGGAAAHIGGALLSGLGVLFGMVAASVVLVGAVALLILLIRFLIVGTKAAELYLAQHRDEVAAPVPADPAPPKVAPRTSASPAAPRTRAPRTPRTPPSA